MTSENASLGSHVEPVGAAGARDPPSSQGRARAKPACCGDLLTADLSREARDRP